MAITYVLSISKIGKGVAKSAASYSVSAQVTDDTKAVGHQTESVCVQSALLDTPERKAAVWDNLQAQYLAKVGVADVASALEVEGKAYLEE